MTDRIIIWRDILAGWFILIEFKAPSVVNGSFYHFKCVWICVEGTIVRAIIELKVNDCIDSLLDWVKLNVNFYRCEILESTFVVRDSDSGSWLRWVSFVTGEELIAIEELIILCFNTLVERVCVIDTS
jgi:hypothetical protein